MPSVPASEICFLSGLPAKPTGQKVRFLGCVTDYDMAAGVLTLQHKYQSSTADASSANTVRAHVNVDLVLERLTAEQMTVGAWVNVMGYVTGVHTTAKGSRRSTSVDVQALLLWSTGPLDVQAYERQLGGMLSMTTSTGTGT